MNALESYVAPARTRPAIWLPLLGIIAIGGGWIAGTVAIIAVWVLIQAELTGSLEAAMNMLPSLQSGGEASHIVVMLLTFLGVWMGLWLALEVVHRQRFMTIFAPGGRIHWRDLWLGVGLAAVVALPSLGLAFIVAEPNRTDVAIGDWAIWLLPIAAAVCVQATAEELIFRGYMVQQIARRTTNVVAWAVVPSILFGMLHFDGGLPDNGGLYYIAVTLMMGMTLAALVWRSGNLWSAVGLHIGNNIIGLNLVGAEGLPGGTQLWIFPSADLEMIFRADLASSILMLAVVVSPLGRIFGTGKVPDSTIEVFR